MNKIYIGTDKYKEELYINLEDNNLDGWSFMGLRPATLEQLEENARDTDITELYTIPTELDRYIDHQQFEDDMVNGALERHDSQGEYHINDVTYYLGFGSGQSINNYFKEHNIKNYKSFCNYFEDYLITEKQFLDLLDILKIYKENKTKGYNKFLKWSENISEYPKFTDEYKKVE